MSSISTDILIIGAGPGGLACAKVLAEQGRKVLVLERRQEIGPKVCAGGITRNGLLPLLPAALIERSFSKQHIFSACQQAAVQEKNPIVATVSRKVLGQWMTEQAVQAGAEIIASCKVNAVHGRRVTAASGGASTTFICSQLVGADGANSIVRQRLNLPAAARGIGINFQVSGFAEEMEWHLSAKQFGSGYAWIFPHKETVSVGAYSPQAGMSAGRLKRSLIRWAEKKGFRQLDEQPCQAALINYDYQGHQFGATWLVGDAAGLASGLTGEGLYSAVVSGEAAARRILDPQSHDSRLPALLRRQQQHRRIINLAVRRPVSSLLLMELFVLLLRARLLSFHALEMASTPQHS
jgi:geranylgeranyl reductase